MATRRSAQIERERMQKRQKRCPAQTEDRQPGTQRRMTPEPITIRDDYRGSGKLEGRVALITGGDSGIGRAVAVHFAREGCDVAIGYLDEEGDAQETQRLVEEEGRRCVTIRGDLRNERACVRTVETTVQQLGRLDVLVINHAEQHPEERPEQISRESLRATFDTNIMPFFFLTQAALEYLEEGSSIITTSSVTAFRGSEHLLDYSATKGAIRTFTYSLAKNLVERGIRVNGVAPGPIWTPLITSTFDAKHVKEFGKDTPMKRAGEPCEVAPAYVFLASEDASYVTGQFSHVHGGGYLA